MNRALHAKTSLLAALLAVAALAAALSVPALGCGGDDGQGETATAAATTTTSTTAGREVATYVERVRELVNAGDDLNAAYRSLVERYNDNDLPVEELISRAKRNAGAYRDMVEQLESMEPPADLEEAHDLLVSGFGKWERSFQLDVQGLNRQDNALLDQASKLDDEAVDEVNRAVDAINRIKD